MGVVVRPLLTSSGWKRPGGGRTRGCLPAPSFDTPPFLPLSPLHFPGSFSTDESPALPGPGRDGPSERAGADVRHAGRGRLPAPDPLLADSAAGALNWTSPPPFPSWGAESFLPAAFGSGDKTPPLHHLTKEEAGKWRPFGSKKQRCSSDSAVKILAGFLSVRSLIQQFLTPPPTFPLAMGNARISLGKKGPRTAEGGGGRPRANLETSLLPWSRRSTMQKHSERNCLCSFRSIDINHPPSLSRFCASCTKCRFSPGRPCSLAHPFKERLLLVSRLVCVCV